MKEKIKEAKKKKKLPKLILQNGLNDSMTYVVPSRSDC